MTAVRKRKVAFVTPYLYDRSRNVNSVTGGKSLAVPNQTLSVREIMVRFTRGVTPLGRQGGYNDEFIPDYDRMDLAEQDEFRREQAQRIKDLTVEAEERVAQAANARKGQVATNDSGTAPLSESDKGQSVAKPQGASDQSGRGVATGQSTNTP